MMRHILLTITALMGTFASADDHLDPFINTDVFELEVAADPQFRRTGPRLLT